ncbi:DoxX family protein [soil metagenome]
MEIVSAQLYKQNRSKTFWLYAMVVLYIAAGINHFINPGIYMQIMPSWLHSPLLLVYASGGAEVLLGLLLIPLTTRRIACFGIILLLIAVFPANIQMTVNYFRESNPYAWLTVLRLPLQFALIRLAYKFYKRPALIRTVSSVLTN